MVTSENPYAPTHFTSDSALPIRKSRPRRFWNASTFTAVLLLGSILSAVAAFNNIESIVISGAIMFIIAAIQMIFCIRRGTLLALCGAAVMLFAIGCLLTIWMKSWSPSEAQTPVSTAIGILSLLLNTQWIVLWNQMAKAREQDSAADATGIGAAEDSA